MGSSAPRPPVSPSTFLNIHVSLTKCLRSNTSAQLTTTTVFSVSILHPLEEEELHTDSAMGKTLVEAEQKKNIPLVIDILSALLKRTTSQNDELTVSQQYRRHPPSVAKAFSDFVIPTISIRRYLEHIFLKTDCSTCCYVIAFIYLDRFLYFNPSVRLDSFNVHRFLITAILTSVKFMDGRYYGNTHFAYVGGISVSEMNELEVDFLFGLRFNLNVNPISYNGYCSFLLKEMSLLKLKDPCDLQFLSSEEEDSD